MIEPHFAAQVTDALAVNCCVCPWGVIADTGVMTMGETTFGFVVAVWPPLVAVAIMVHNFGYSGALNRPAEEIDPQLSFSVHVEGLLAENCWVAASNTVGLEGAIENPVEVIVSEAKAVN